MKIQDLVSALTYVKDFTGKPVIIKLGGSSLSDKRLVSLICHDLILLRSVGLTPILVHGGGPAINEELTRRGIQWSFHEGLRITTPEMMDVIEMVLVGKVNRMLVRELCHLGARAVGISGIDGRTLLCKQMSQELGLVGDIEKVNLSLVKSVMEIKSELGFAAIPVIAPVALGHDGKSYNINADWAASRIAAEMGVEKLIFVTDQDGILGKDKKLLPELDAADLESLVENGTVTGGMLAKAKTVLHAIEHGVTNVHIINGQRPHALVEELFTETGVGTICRRRSKGLSSFAGLELTQ